jgi:hypothetical protein
MSRLREILPAFGWKGSPLVHFVFRALQLAGFEPVIFGVLWQGKATPIVETFLRTIQDVPNLDRDWA